MKVLGMLKISLMRKKKKKKKKATMMIKWKQNFLKNLQLVAKERNKLIV